MKKVLLMIGTRKGAFLAFFQCGPQAMGPEGSFLQGYPGAPHGRISEETEGPFAPP